MRLVPLLLFVALLACSRKAERPPGPPVVAPAGSTLSGTIEGRPFAARGALLVGTTAWQDGRVTTRIVVFERPIDCAAAKTAIPGERTIEISFGVRWPVMPGSVWVAKTFEGLWDRPDSVEIAFTKHGASQVGTFADGRVVVEQASAREGVLSVEATREGTGSASGEVHFAVCPS